MVLKMQFANLTDCKANQWIGLKQPLPRRPAGADAWAFKKTNAFCLLLAK